MARAPRGHDSVRTDRGRGRDRPSRWCGRGRSRSAARALAAVLLATGGVACSDSDGSNGADTSGTLRVLAGSELADLEPILDEAAEAIGVTVELELTGTLEGLQQVVDGSADGEYDAVWFSSNRYLALQPGAQGRIQLENRIMASPVILGLSASRARELGWDGDAEVTWSDIATAAGEGRFSYGMTNPAESNSGFSAVVGVTAALAETGAALEQDDIDAVVGELQDFFSAQRLTAGSSGWLADAYVARAAGEQPGTVVDGLINYESVLLSLNEDAAVPEPMTLIYPSDGVITADYPLSLLGSASESTRDDYERLVDHLLQPDVQTEIMERTHRRPAAPEVEPDARFGTASLVELPFPARLDVVDGLIATYFNRLRRPVRTIYVLDISGSMQGQRIAALREALTGLTGADNTLASQSRQFHSREEVTFVPFDDTTREPQAFVVPEEGADQVRSDIAIAAQALRTGGDTAIYDSLVTAYDLLEDASSPEDYAMSIVLMTDGENNSGRSPDSFVRFHEGLDERLATVPIFTILFGEANVAEMEQLAAMTGGRTFDALSGDLEAAFQEIRGYQ